MMDWLPHRWCFDSDPIVTVGYIVGHVGQALGYLLVCWGTVYRLRKSGIALPRRFRILLRWSIAYLLVCGASHVASLVTVWAPVYRFEVFVLVAGVATAWTAAWFYLKAAPVATRAGIDAWMRVLADELRKADAK